MALAPLGFHEAATKVDHTPIPYDETGLREWFVMELNTASSAKREEASENSSGLLSEQRKIYFTFIVFPPGEFTMGSPDAESRSRLNEVAASRSR